MTNELVLILVGYGVMMMGLPKPVRFFCGLILMLVAALAAWIKA